MHVDIFHQQAVLKDVGRKLTLGSSGEKARILQNLTKRDQERQGKILEKLACSVADGKGGQLDMLANRIRSQKDAIISTLTNGSEHEKKQVLDRIYDELAKAAQPSKSEILDKLNRIKRHLLKGCAGRGLHSGIVTLGIPSGYDIGFSAESFVAEWDAMAAASSVSPSALLLPFVSSEHPLNLLKQVHANMPKLQESVAVHAIVKSEKSAYWRITVPCVVARYPGDIGSLDVDALPLPLPAKDHYAMVLLAHILGANEGLLSNAIRDKGLGYSPKLLYDSTMQTCTLVCNKTSNIGEAYDALKTALLGIRSSWDQQIDRFKLEVARSVALFKQVSSVSKPSRLLVAAAEACLQGFADINAKHRWANEHLRAVTLDDLRHVFNTFVMPLVDREQSPAITVVISSDDSCSGIGEQALESKQLEALFDWISG
ncbi:hypothetical protein EC988_006229 [Linderina pennispora]|nr:hypothetical protein EC988_006229 [Linderina pennispora]